MGIAQSVRSFCNNKNTFAFTLLIFIASAIALTFITPGTFDEGDSVMHFQFAKWAPIHPELFFHHWAKPLFVLLASPFAQFGFTGMKFFQIAISALAMLLTYLTARTLHIKNAPLVGLFLLFSPSFLCHTLSGLTEPLFALLLIAPIYLFLKNRIVWALLLVSFLPFVRSEGLIICGVFGALLLLEQQYKLIPLLLFGHVVYSVAGYPVHSDLLWVFAKIPYARMDSIYGQGTWFHFFENLPVITGVPLCILLATGVAAKISYLFRIGFTTTTTREVFLIYGCFAAYFIAHVCFWALGIFNSFGMMRVLVGVLPLMVLIELQGFNALVAFFRTAFSRSFAIATILVYVIVFPFTPNHYAWNYKRDFCLLTTQVLIEEMVQYIRSTYPDYENYCYFFDANYVSQAMNIDYFDEKVSKRVWANWEHLSPNSFVIWDDWYSAFEMKTSLESVADNPKLEFVKEFSTKYHDGNERRIILFKAREATH